MKLKEQLAKNYLRYVLDSYPEDCDVLSDFEVEAAYLAGFEEARSLIIHAIKERSEAIGEEEVGEK